MSRIILSLSLILGLVTIAPAQMNITGYLYSDALPVNVDSVYFEYAATRVWFQTPGWTCNPGETASYTFPEFAGWPAIIKIVFMAAGMPGFDSLYRPASDSWYHLQPPNEMVQVMFHGELGIQEQKPASMSAILPGVITYQQLLNLFNNPTEIEVVNHLGQKVNPLNLRSGIYFYRNTGTRVYHRFLLFR